MANTYPLDHLEKIIIEARAKRSLGRLAFAYGHINEARKERDALREEIVRLKKQVAGQEQLIDFLKLLMRKTDQKGN